MRPQVAWLPDGRLHLHHGPIDLIIAISGTGRHDGYARAHARFDTILDELVTELAMLRSPVGPQVTGPTARRMVAATAPYRPTFITPMAAVAGAVADEILSAILDGPNIDKAHVNNGGDVAFHLAPGQTATAAVAGDPVMQVPLTADDGIGGMATSGWRGRSLSLGIADGVTALAPTAAAADAAATMIANAVDLPDHPAITRAPANAHAPDSDLGNRPVTIAVGPLTPAEIAQALDAGETLARDLITKNRILGAALTLAGEMRTTGHVPFKELNHA